jgi:phosphoribosyl 1,2-cyclic phosphodiesterase
MSVDVTFWGVRGSFPCASPHYMAYGGNTSCVSLEVDGQTVIFDAGTGLFQLGKYLAKKGCKAATLLMSHTHTDHILGFPFFAPAWMGKNFELTIMAGHLADAGGIESVFEVEMRDPVFPVQLGAMGGASRFVDFRAGDRFTLPGDIAVRTCALNHPNGATGYRVEARGRSVCYITDTEHVVGQLDRRILDLVEGADVMIYDCCYLPETFAKRIGWGHSTWQEGMRLAQAGGVHKLMIFHHDPDHTDDVMERIEREATVAWEGCVVAREGMILSLAPSVALAAE